MTNVLTEQVLIAVGGIMLGFCVGWNVPQNFICSNKSVKDDTNSSVNNENNENNV